ncbi:myb-like protein X [Gossypium australe]|uniref:Myb-like protein X n=1 Tax=Gossypium australe TaxID=47621 RepID=A0A5B6UA09_9ROSI|nr:myb-like protein X [Gossypium australe]
MSRCFPFPPPGYEKKARIENEDLLKKEKEKEKKHKKEKKDKDKDKDKEKREKKEKKEKDKSDGKHKDKKDKKEKYRDKKKEKKEKDRDKEKDRSQSGDKFIQKEKGRDKDRSSTLDEKKHAGQFLGYNGQKVSQNSNLAEDFRDSKFVQGRRIRDEGPGAGDRFAEKFMVNDNKRDEQMVRLVAKTANTPAEGMEKNKRSDDSRAEGIPGQAENNTERRGEGKEKTKEKESNDKIKDKHKEKKSHGKEKDGDREKHEAAVKAKTEHRNLEQDNLKGSKKDDPVGTKTQKSLDPFDVGNKGAVAVENLHKRKDREKNGFFHVDDIKPNKQPRTTSSHPLTDNGRTLESCEAPIAPTSDTPKARTSLKADNNERKVNGIIEAQLSSISPTKHLSTSAKASQTDKVFMKPPHPDTKYLSQVLSVPEMEEWPDFDDQAWLFSSNESQSKKNPKVGFPEIDETPHVWSEALQIESADVYALPYVIPY